MNFLLKILNNYEQKKEKINKVKTEAKFLGEELKEFATFYLYLYLYQDLN
ncbi:hypothetical protein QE422_002464 [Chryseobacterium sp. SORGH_AS 447]|nr:hypothetical protein [Chryseobacterium sp. SORGH_AS_0447]MDQ1162096.1 hypothetical protein [Chryseobacterium sp. SORGH_AS_0447]